MAARHPGTKSYHYFVLTAGISIVRYRNPEMLQRANRSLRCIVWRKLCDRVGTGISGGRHLIRFLGEHKYEADESQVRHSVIDRWIIIRLCNSANGSADDSTNRRSCSRYRGANRRSSRYRYISTLSRAHDRRFTKH
jgi:hypothetical protein